MMWPECAAFGTVSSSPALVLRKWEVGELRTIRPPGVRGKAIVEPEPRPLPATSSGAWPGAGWGLPLHFAAGTRAPLVIRPLSPGGLVEGVPPTPAAMAH